MYNSSGSLGLAAQRHKLPIARYKDHILYLLEKHQVKVSLLHPILSGTYVFERIAE